MNERTPSSAESTKNTAEYAVEIPTLKSLFLEVRRGELVISTGTAILLAADQESPCILVTNRHIVTGRHQESGECLHRLGALPDNLCVYFHENTGRLGDWKKIPLPLFKSDGTPWWIEHPELGAAADIVALEVRWGSDVAKFPYYLKGDLDRVHMAINPAEPVSVIGFPFGLPSKEKFPIWATGFLAQELSLITPKDPVFLIDCRTRQGQSGSAVIAYRPAGYRFTKDDRVASSLTPNVKWEFLGIYSGRVNSESDLGKVWHVSAVENLYEATRIEIDKRQAARRAHL